MPLTIKIVHLFIQPFIQIFCSPLATSPTWSKLKIEQQNSLYEEGVNLWLDLIENLQPDIMLISVPKALFQKVISEESNKMIKMFTDKKDGTKRKNPYEILQYSYKLKSNKSLKVIYGQAANKPFDTISNQQKQEVGKLCLK